MARAIHKFLLGTLVLQLALSAMAGVSPANVQRDLLAGEERCFDKWVTVPDQPTKLDFVLVVDLSGSYRNDLTNIKNKANAIFNGLKAAVPDLRVAVASFVDYPRSPYGSSGAGDYAYQLHLDLTASGLAFKAAIDGMVTRSGRDSPESQYEALHSVINGHAGFVNRGVNYCSLPPAGRCNAVSFRPDSARIIALTTDASAHNSDTEAAYPGTGKAATIAALQAENAAVIGIRAGGGGGFLVDVAAQTGGTTVATNTASSQIVDAILMGLQEITYTVYPSWYCPGTWVSHNPPRHYNVKGGETVHFHECLRYEGSVCTGPRTCHINFFAGSLKLGTEWNRLDCCEHGEFLNGAKCEECPAGYKGTWPPSYRCMNCGCGAVSNADSTACEDCPMGPYASAANSDVCEVCGPGTYVSPDECRCAECGIDMFCPGTGVELPCPPGTFALPGSAECAPIECPDEPDHFSHDECDEWIVGDLDGMTNGGKPYHGLLLRNLFDFGYYGFTFQNDRTPAVGNEVKAFAVLDYCRSMGRFNVRGWAYGGRLDGTGNDPIPAEAESCEFSIVYDTFVSTTGPGNPGHIRVGDGEGWIKCPSHPQVRIHGKTSYGAQLELMAKYIDEWKANGWLTYPDMDGFDEDRNSTPQDIDFVPLCRLPHTIDLLAA